MKVLSSKKSWFSLSLFRRNLCHLWSFIVLEQGVKDYTVMQILRGYKVKKNLS